MAILTAKELKERESPERVVDLGDGAEVRARRPDLPTMVFSGLVSTPLLNEVVRLIASWQGQDLATVTRRIVSEDSGAMLDFIDKWVCAAMVEPRCVAKVADAVDGAVWIEDLTLPTRVKIFTATFHIARKEQAVREAADEFPEDGPRAGTGPDVPEVQPAPEPSARPH